MLFNRMIRKKQKSPETGLDKIMVPLEKTENKVTKGISRSDH